jgi:hypothetical protein
MFGRTFSRALVASLTLSIVMAGVVFADNAVSDGDGVTPITNQDMAFGSIDCSASTTKNALVAISRNGGAGTTNVFKDGSTVTISILSETNADATVPATNTITLPSNWGSLPNNSLSGSISVPVTIDSSVEGSGSGSVTFRATGVNASNATINRDDLMNISWSVTAGTCNTAPELTLPASMIVEGNTLGGANVSYSVTADDAEDGDLSASVDCSPASGSFFALGTTTVDCSVEDSGNLSDSGSFDVTVVDTTGPTVTAPADINLEGNTIGGATQASVLALLDTASAYDIVSGAVSASITDPTPLPDPFPLGTTTITYSALDGEGNSGSDTTGVTVVDTTDPIISGMPSNISTTTMNSAGKVVTWTSPSASDIVDSSVPVICSPASGSTFAIGTTTVTCTATDDSGNSANASFTVTVGLLSALWKEPINGPSVINVAKAGRVIPVKVEVFLNGAENVDTGTVTFRLYKSNSCTAGAQDSVEAFAAAGDANTGDLFRWDPTGGFYIYNLKTPATTGCYSGEVLLNGERAGYFFINLTK